ncbi:hypothetical protein J3R30DRAFT_9966 [Lentinula aciculospora]|uniref:Uncharacterized protein n=1 Tax=Lentinula aciculospora TaxID=153920 RepID=A0A9W9DWQ9_9AGAR|nr:hypothetical protein J3R30DRAFT_9966 [Lentinula aciculospora]
MLCTGYSRYMIADIARHVFSIFLGSYIPLSIACMLIVYRRKRKAYKIQIGAMLLLALASTVSIIVQCVNQGRALLAMLRDDYEGASTSEIVQDNMTTALIHDYVVLGIYIFSNVIADALLLYRCFIIWDKDIRVVLLPLLGYLGNIILGILGLSYNDEFVFEFWILAIVENVVLTALITGKIWYIKHEAGGILGSAVKIKYNMIAAIILESGFVYSAIVLATSVTSMMTHNAIYASCLLAAATQIVGIAPCLMIIRIALGVDTRDVLSSIAIMTNHTTSGTIRQTIQDPSEFRNDILNSGQAIFRMETRENPDLEEGGGTYEQSLRVQGKYTEIADNDRDNPDSSTYNTISASEYHEDDKMLTPKLTPNAQQVVFARSDSAVVGLPFPKY